MTTPKPPLALARSCAVLVRSSAVLARSSLVASLSLAALGCSPSQATLDAQFQALQRHQARSEKRQVAGSVFQNPKAAAEHCGPAAAAPLSVDCSHRLQGVFFARLEVGYPLANWAEIALVCDAYPRQCDSAQKLEALAARSQEEASQTQLDVDYARIAADERSRSSRNAPPAPLATAPTPAQTMDQTRADHESKAPYLHHLEEQLWRATAPAETPEMRAEGQGSPGDASEAAKTSKR